MKALLLDLLQLFFRMVPHPTRPRLIRFGTPDKTSPVLVTVNSSLTVRRLSRILKSIDCYLLVAPAEGINVWCGSVGGHFTVDSVISIIKTSHIGRLVGHRRLILPQLCAPSISSKELHERAGWTAQFGPIRAEDIPEYLRNGKRVTPAMTEVRYSPKDRIEMASAMSGSIIVRYSIFPLVAFGLWGVAQFALAVLAISASLHLFKEKLPGNNTNHQALLIALLTSPLFLVIENPAMGWPLASFGVILIAGAILVSQAYSGYTPFKQCSYSKQFFGYEPLEIDIVAEECTGCTLCDWVCPVDCFAPVQLSTGRKVFAMVSPSNCVECAACLTQCPTGAVVNIFPTRIDEPQRRCA